METELELLEVFKTKPQDFFSDLPKQAEQEIMEFLQFILFKYKKKKETLSTNSNKEFLNFVQNNKFQLPADYKFNREEANER
jgi:uncharacterized UBP type Zn finger protein